VNIHKVKISFRLSFPSSENKTETFHHQFPFHLMLHPCLIQLSIWIQIRSWMWNIFLRVKFRLLRRQKSTLTSSLKKLKTFDNFKLCILAEDWKKLFVSSFALTRERKQSNLEEIPGKKKTESYLLQSIFFFKKFQSEIFFQKLDKVVEVNCLNESELHS
jgi:hypothetical protein